MGAGIGSDIKIVTVMVAFLGGEKELGVVEIRDCRATGCRNFVPAVVTLFPRPLKLGPLGSLRSYLVEGADPNAEVCQYSGEMVKSETLVAYTHKGSNEGFLEEVVPALCRELSAFYGPHGATTGMRLNVSIKQFKVMGRKVVEYDEYITRRVQSIIKEPHIGRKILEPLAQVAMILDILNTCSLPAGGAGGIDASVFSVLSEMSDRVKALPTEERDVLNSFDGFDAHFVDFGHLWNAYWTKESMSDAAIIVSATRAIRAFIRYTCVQCGIDDGPYLARSYDSLANR